jgi:hypothetical protein
MLKRIGTILFAALALVAVAAPAAGAKASTSPDRLQLDLEIFDLDTSTACGADVFANVSFVSDRHVRRDRTGAVRSVTETYHGSIEWFTRGTGKSYSSRIEALVRNDFPEGVDFFKPARITVVGRNGGVFPIGGGPAGDGILVYNGFIYSLDDEDVPYTTTEGDPIVKLGNFTTTTKRICRALA